jgi:hypothetical protein
MCTCIYSEVARVVSWLGYPVTECESASTSRKQAAPVHGVSDVIIQQWLLVALLCYSRSPCAQGVCV